MDVVDAKNTTHFPRHAHHWAVSRDPAPDLCGLRADHVDRSCMDTGSTGLGIGIDPVLPYGAQIERTPLGTALWRAFCRLQTARSLPYGAQSTMTNKQHSSMYTSYITPIHWGLTTSARCAGQTFWLRNVCLGSSGPTIGTQKQHWIWIPPATLLTRATHTLVQPSPAVTWRHKLRPVPRLSVQSIWPK